MTTYVVGGLVCAAVAAGVVGLTPFVARLWATPARRARVRIEKEFRPPAADEALGAFKDLHKPTAAPPAPSGILPLAYPTAVPTPIAHSATIPNR